MCTIADMSDEARWEGLVTLSRLIGSVNRAVPFVQVP
jgi:hypothetical protein